jgi:hypothetical protein
LPLSALPFPIVSPYRRAVSKSSAPTPSVASKSQLPGSLFGAPTNAATPNTRGKSGLGDFFSGLDSANRAETSFRRTSLFATSNSSARKVSLPPPTPPASRTLFGTEVADNGRFGDAGAEADEEEEDDSPRLRWGAFAAWVTSMNRLSSLLFDILLVLRVGYAQLLWLLFPLLSRTFLEFFQKRSRKARWARWNSWISGVQVK